MKRIFLSFLTSCIFLVIYTGCATLFKSSHKTDIDVMSKPGQAKVYVNGTYRGTTPTKLNLSNENSYEVKIEKEGFAPMHYTIGKKVGVKWIILDILGGGIPIIVDAVTGNWYELDKESISVDLSKE